MGDIRFFFSRFLLRLIIFVALPRFSHINFPALLLSASGSGVQLRIQDRSQVGKEEIKKTTNEPGTEIESGMGFEVMSRQKSL